MKKDLTMQNLLDQLNVDEKIWTLDGDLAWHKTGAFAVGFHPIDGPFFQDQWGKKMKYCRGVEMYIKTIKDVQFYADNLVEEHV